MQLKNSPQNYGFIAKTFHWLTALLILGAYMSVYYRHWFTEAKTPENWTALQLHLSVGVSVGIIILLRVIYRLMSEQPEHEPGTKLEHLAAKLGHFALYVVLIVMPITGFVGTGVATDFFFMFEITKFSDTWLFQALVADGLGLTFKAFEAPMDFIHKEVLGAWLLWMLAAGHVAAALYHHFVKKDRTLVKMTKS